VGGILGPVVAIVNIIVIAFIAYHLHHLEAAREETTRRAEHAIALRTVTLAQWDLWNSREMLHSRIAANRIPCFQAVPMCVTHRSSHENNRR
jgi:hypothetical protein